MERLITIKQIAAYLEEKNLPHVIQGNPEETVCGFSSLSRYQEGTITWINSPQKTFQPSVRISACVIQEGADLNAAARIITPQSKAVFFSVLEHFWADTPDNDIPDIGPGSVIGSNVRIGENVKIGCNCSITGNVSIGSGTVIADNVVIRNRVKIGCNCTIQSLTVIGEDGYGYSENDDHMKTMIRHFGGVTIGDDVFIGSHTNIARGTIDDTVIESGTKIAPSTHIGHNNYIGKNSSIVCSKLFGSVVVGDNAYVSASIVRNQAKIGKDSIIGMGSVVTTDVEENKVVVGVPAKIIRENSGKEKL
mgnify:CR=1 FL=1